MCVSSLANHSPARSTRDWRCDAGVCGLNPRSTGATSNGRRPGTPWYPALRLTPSVLSLRFTEVMMARTPLGRAVPVVAGILLTAGLAGAQGVPRLDSYQGVAVRILQSNNAGNTHHIIDPTINQVVGAHPGLPARAQPDHPSRRALLLLRERAGQHGRRLRHEDAPARAADRPFGAAQQDCRQQEAAENLRGDFGPIREGGWPRLPGAGRRLAARGRRRHRHRHPQGGPEHSRPPSGSQHLRHAR